MRKVLRSLRSKISSKITSLVLVVSGVLIMVSSSFISCSSIEKVVSVGILLILSPAIIFQFMFFSGRSGLVLEKSDLKKFWFWVFITFFIIVDIAILSLINIFFGILPQYSEWLSTLLAQR